MDVVHTLIVCSLDWISPATREVIDAIVVHRGHLGRDADAFAGSLGYRDRHHLARQLKREGLLPLQELAAWVRILWWVSECEGERMALGRLALVGAHDPAVWYKTVERITGLSWPRALEAGCAFLVLRLREQCTPPSQTRRPRRRSKDVPAPGAHAAGRGPQGGALGPAGAAAGG